MHVYSIDEVFMDMTGYLKTYKMSSKELAMKIILDVLKTTGITATAGIGPNLYLCKVAMDIEAKHIPPDKNGVRIAELEATKSFYGSRVYTMLEDEETKLWHLSPLTLYNMYDEEQKTGTITFPEEA